MSDFTIAGESYKEEKRAVKAYTSRGGQANSPQLKKHLSHALREEKEHVKLFRQDLKKKRYSSKEVNRAREMAENSSSHYAKRPDMEGRVY